MRQSDRFDEGSERDYHHAVLISATEVPEGLDVLDCPAGAWAVFENAGPFPQALRQMRGEVAAQWMPSHPYEYRPGPEILRSRPTQDAPTWSDAHLWIPVTRTSV
ncbi:GyrI-like domain-containing protein [Streptomyces sp. NPDC018610]|uniref:GyrI-like domain-containing protein n=1 Tax=Streptomyces sp. NPDC018610 TaxID=3365049 RepID=UPI00378FB3C9